MMKNNLFSLGLFAAVGSFNSTAQETIRISTGEYPPVYSEKLPDNGKILHIVRQAFAQMDIKVEYGFFPWSRTLELAKNNAWDATCCWGLTPERSQYFNYTDEVTTREYVFYHLKSYPFDWHSVDDLTDIEIGITYNYSYGHELNSAVRAGKLLAEYASSDEINFRKLLGGRIKVFPIDRKLGYQLLSSLFKPAEVQLLTYHPKPIVLTIVGLMVSKTSKQVDYIIETFNEGLKRYKASGDYDRYIAELERSENQLNQ
ncbi:transporter substrate-binding domain-containing protein [Thalassomonas sp. RHCl1]|uniref:substrate-binding periplasmic protein n=1 Tax=Thalassomonas sp. RHCl1 TaxID=2995320 RepID=UPI00248B8C95|nr:transporter substrate-binding domain-containing protein [Thalassomonas sp. RHCl1]